MKTIGDLPERCRGCVAWELEADAIAPTVLMGDGEFEKEVWLSGVMLTWGSAGQIVTVDDVPVGFALFAPPTAVPGASAFPTSPVSPDAVLLTTARILPEFTGQGLARYLLNGVVSALTRRGVRAIEVFGREDPYPMRSCRDEVGDAIWRRWPEPWTRPRWRPKKETPFPQCLLPAGFARAVGFVTSPRIIAIRGCVSSSAGTSAGRPRWSRRWRSCSPSSRCRTHRHRWSPSWSASADAREVGSRGSG